MTDYITYANVTSINFSDGALTTLWTYGDTVSGGFASPFLLALIAIVSYVSFADQYKGGSKGLTASAGLTFFSAFLMLGAGMLDITYFLIATIYLALGIYKAYSETGF